MECTLCKTAFFPKVHNAKYCSDTCRQIAKNNTHKQWQEDNKEQLKIKDAQRYQEEKPQRIERDRLYRRQKMAEDPIYKLRANLRKRLNKAISIIQKTGSAIGDLGCSVEDFKLYLESKFEPGMSWDNYGRKPGIRCWEIDHIVPLASALNEQNLRTLCHYSNLQPMWAEDNWSKGGRLSL